MMFPDEDKERKFGMQEKVLADAVGSALGVHMGKGGRGEVLRKWRDGEGCLGMVVGEVVRDTNPVSRLIRIALNIELICLYGIK